MNPETINETLTREEKQTVTKTILNALNQQSTLHLGQMRTLFVSFQDYLAEWYNDAYLCESDITTYLLRYTEASSTNELNHYYQPINYLDGFKTISFSMHPEKMYRNYILLLKEVIRYFLPDETLEQTDNALKVTLSSDTFLKYHFLSTTMADSSWNNRFFSVKHPTLLRTNEHIKSFFSELFGNSNNQLFTHLKKIEMTRNDLTFSTYSFEISTSPTHPYFTNTNISSNAVYINDLMKLTEMLRLVQFFSDIYPAMQQEILTVYEETLQEQEEKQKEAVDIAVSMIEQRVIPMDKVTHKTGRHYAEKENITDVIYPFVRSKHVLTEDFPLRVYRDDKHLWYASLPFDTYMEEDGGYIFVGHFLYDGYNENTNMHEVKQWDGDESRTYAVEIDIDVLNTAVASYDHLFNDRTKTAINNTQILLEQFPQLFSRTSPDILDLHSIKPKHAAIDVSPKQSTIIEEEQSIVRLEVDNAYYEMTKIAYDDETNIFQLKGIGRTNQGETKSYLNDAIPTYNIIEDIKPLILANVLSSEYLKELSKDRDYRDTFETRATNTVNELLERIDMSDTQIRFFHIDNFLVLMERQTVLGTKYLSDITSTVYCRNAAYNLLELLESNGIDTQLNDGQTYLMPIYDDENNLTTHAVLIEPPSNRAEQAYSDPLESDDSPFTF